MISFKRFLENQPPTDWDALFADAERKILADPQAREELAQNFLLDRKTVMRILGTPTGTTIVLTNMFNRKHGDEMKNARVVHDREVAAKNAIPPDPYLYHVTTKRNLAKIKRGGLKPGMPSQFSNYQAYSQGKVFLCDKAGINFWKWKVEDHEEHNSVSGRTSPVVVLRIPKQAVPDLQPDEAGTTDSRQPCFYTTQAIPSRFVELVG
jgi:hypothetical protein